MVVHDRTKIDTESETSTLQYKKEPQKGKRGL